MPPQPVQDHQAAGTRPPQRLPAWAQAARSLMALNRLPQPPEDDQCAAVQVPARIYLPRVDETSQLEEAPAWRPTRGAVDDIEYVRADLAAGAGPARSPDRDTAQAAGPATAPRPAGGSALAAGPGTAAGSGQALVARWCEDWGDDRPSRSVQRAMAEDIDQAMAAALDAQAAAQAQALAEAQAAAQAQAEAKANAAAEARIADAVRAAVAEVQAAAEARAAGAGAAAGARAAAAAQTAALVQADAEGRRISRPQAPDEAQGSQSARPTRRSARVRNAESTGQMALELPESAEPVQVQPAPAAATAASTPEPAAAPAPAPSLTASESVLPLTAASASAAVLVPTAASTSASPRLTPPARSAPIPPPVASPARQPVPAPAAPRRSGPEPSTPSIADPFTADLFADEPLQGEPLQAEPAPTELDAPASGDPGWVRSDAYLARLWSSANAEALAALAGQRGGLDVTLWPEPTNEVDGEAVAITVERLEAEVGGFEAHWAPQARVIGYIARAEARKEALFAALPPGGPLRGARLHLEPDGWYVHITRVCNRSGAGRGPSL